MLVYSLFYVISFFTFSLNLNVAEWIDMPQFSDESKIYRMPSIQHDQFYKFRRGNANNNVSVDLQNDSQIFHRPVNITHTMNDKKLETEKINSIETTVASYSFSDQIAHTFTEIDRIPTSTSIEDKLFEGYDMIAPTEDTMFETLANQSPSLSTIKQKVPPQDEYYNRTSKHYDIFQYLPIDILKNVHRILQTQPASFEGKIHFLNTFEKTLMLEIESRLATTMAPRRRRRGADYHGYDDHDDSVGFPSIEGALMAISFLTFAVYLVRLVMLLFQNINNSTTTTTTAAALFLGKRKRSADLDDDTVRILNNIDNFSLS